MADRLPPELLLECLRRADLPTRVHASHVSRTWRDVALSDSQLWDSFSCSDFRDVQHQDAMFHQLQAMLLRSHSLPFRLRIPHRYHGGSASYCLRLLGLNELDMRRLMSYDGPMDVFSRLIQDRTPLPTLTSLNVINPNVKWDSVTVKIAGLFSGHSFPNLESLQAPLISFSPSSHLFPAVRHLICSLDDAGDIVRLFDLFPNIVHLQITTVEPSDPFPPVSLPVSLRTIVLCPFGRFEVHVPWTLQHWEGVRIRRLVARAVGTARGTLSLFVAMHPHPVNLRLNSRDGEMVFSTPEDEYTWTLTPSQKSPATFLNGLETRSCDRLTSISVGMEQLGRLFAARLHVPELALLEFRLDGKQEPPLLHAHDDSFVIRVPRLQHVAFSANGRPDAIHARMDEIQSVLVVLCASFRALVVYDADMLESITLSAPPTGVRKFDCSSFACFAKDYRVCVTVTG